MHGPGARSGRWQASRPGRRTRPGSLRRVQGPRREDDDVRWGTPMGLNRLRVAARDTQGDLRPHGIPRDRPRIYGLPRYSAGRATLSHPTTDHDAHALDGSPYCGVAAPTAESREEYTGPVIHDAQAAGFQYAPRARQRLLRRRKMTTTRPWREPRTGCSFSGSSPGLRASFAASGPTRNGSRAGRAVALKPVRRGGSDWAKFASLSFAVRGIAD